MGLRSILYLHLYYSDLSVNTSIQINLNYIYEVLVLDGYFKIKVMLS